jgi:hypothetical protein
MSTTRVTRRSPVRSSWIQSPSCTVSHACMLVNVPYAASIAKLEPGEDPGVGHTPVPVRVTQLQLGGWCFGRDESRVSHVPSCARGFLIPPSRGSWIRVPSPAPNVNQAWS